MRIRKISTVALVAVAAGLSLTACDGGSGNDSSPAPSSSSLTPPAPPAAPTSQSGGTGSPDSTSPTRPNPSPTKAPGTAQVAACQTSNLTFTHSFGMAEGEILINLTNSSSSTCTMHGFPGVDLKGQDGTVSAARSHLNAPDVTLHPGDATRFTLHYPPNNSGGTGVTFTTLLVTPPNETHSRTIPLSINIPATADATGPTITVDPVGAGK
ncbi:DUF4232 domain-containing protein [Streptomyces sp. CA-111067]|uniref:DUF4232 domain-containing protein n=1 Tax=Streptomyces sp. CA-111067 TaxID=3240046 RepID=UPI003D957904